MTKEIEEMKRRGNDLGGKIIMADDGVHGKEEGTNKFFAKILSDIQEMKIIRETAEELLKADIETWRERKWEERLLIIPCLQRDDSKIKSFGEDSDNHQTYMWRCRSEQHDKFSNPWKVFKGVKYAQSN